MNQGFAEPSAKSAPSYQQIIAKVTSEGWQVVTEGPSGAQIKRPRIMRTQTKVVLFVGFLLLIAYGAGLLFLIIGGIDYAMTRPGAHFVSRESPTLPKPGPGMSAASKTVWIVFATLVALVAVAAIFMRK